MLVSDRDRVRSIGGRSGPRIARSAASRVRSVAGRSISAAPGSARPDDAASVFVPTAETATGRSALPVSAVWTVNASVRKLVRAERSDRADRADAGRADVADIVDRAETVEATLERSVRLDVCLEEASVEERCDSEP